MSHEYFGSFSEALSVFTNEQRVRDFQEFVIAFSFVKRFNLEEFEGEAEVRQAVEDFQNFLISIGKSTSVDEDTLIQIIDKAQSLSLLLD